MSIESRGCQKLSTVISTAKNHFAQDHAVAVLFYCIIYLIAILMFSRETLCLARTYCSACVQNTTNI